MEILWKAKRMWRRVRWGFWWDFAWWLENRQHIKRCSYCHRFLLPPLSYSLSGGLWWCEEHAPEVGFVYRQEGRAKDD